MSWSARSIADSLKLDDDDGDGDGDGDAVAVNVDTVQSPSKSEGDQHSDSSSTTPRGVKEDLSELSKTLTRQFWGVASFLAPPPEDHKLPEESNEDVDDDLIAGMRSDFAEIGGKFKSEITKLSSNKTVSEITKIASNLLQFGSQADEDLIGSVVGVTEEVVAFAKDISTHPETWLNFPLTDDLDFEDLDMSDAQQEHALAVERLAPGLGALRIELCPGYMSESCFWNVYFVLLHPRLSKEDALLLSTPQIMEARAMLSHELQKRAKAKSEPDLSVTDTSTSKEVSDLYHEESLSVPSCVDSEFLPLRAVCSEVIPSVVATKASGSEAVSSNAAKEIETDKHPVQSMEIQIIDKAVVEEQRNQASQQQFPSSSSSRILNQKFEDNGDDWLKDEISETVGANDTMVSLNNDEDVSFSDLEDDDGDVPVTYKKVSSSSDTSIKDSRDWVQLGRSSDDLVKDIKPISIKHVGSAQVSARYSDSKESNDWLDVHEVGVI